MLRQIGDLVVNVAGLKQKVDDIAATHLKTQERILGLVERVAKLETEVRFLRENLKAEIMGELCAEIVKTQMMVEQANKRRLD